MAGLERGQGIGVGGEAVHQQQRECRGVVAAQKLDLMNDDVQEAQAVLGDHQRLGLFQAHAGTEPAVELDDDRMRKGLPGGKGIVQIFQAGQGAEFGQRATGDRARAA